jgi:hypothetical protein
MLIEFALGPGWVWLFVDEAPSHWTLDTDRRQSHHRCDGGARNPRTDEQIAPRANAESTGLRFHSAPRITLEGIGTLSPEFPGGKS